MRGALPSMAPRARTPRAHAVVGADEVVARKHGIVAVGKPLYQVAIHVRPPVPAPVVGAERVAEGARRWREERRRERARRALRKQRDARVEAEREVREDGWVELAVFIQGRVRDW
jgi:hypothetical protein